MVFSYYDINKSLQIFWSHNKLNFEWKSNNICVKRTKTKHTHEDIIERMRRMLLTTLLILYYNVYKMLCFDRSMLSFRLFLLNFFWAVVVDTQLCDVNSLAWYCANVLSAPSTYVLVCRFICILCIHIFKWMYPIFRHLFQ